MTHATVLFAHGSRDPLWNKPIEAVAARIRAIDASCLVRCAYLELMTPDLPEAVRDLADAGVDRITIVPMFLGVGRHAREDLPGLVEGLKTAHPHVRITLQPAIGEDAQVVDTMARVALG